MRHYQTSAPTGRHPDRRALLTGITGSRSQSPDTGICSRIVPYEMIKDIRGYECFLFQIFYVKHECWVCIYSMGI